MASSIGNETCKNIQEQTEIGFRNVEKKIETFANKKSRRWMIVGMPVKPDDSYYRIRVLFSLAKWSFQPTRGSANVGVGKSLFKPESGKYVYDEGMKRGRENRRIKSEGNSWRPRPRLGSLRRAVKSALIHLKNEGKHVLQGVGVTRGRRSLAVSLMHRNDESEFCFECILYISASRLSREKRLNAK